MDARDRFTQSVLTAMRRDVEEAGGIGNKGEFGRDGAAGSVLLADPERKISMFYAQHLLNDDNHLEELRDALYRSL